MSQKDRVPIKQYGGHTYDKLEFDTNSKLYFTKDVKYHGRQTNLL
jgi:hypothetical protein